MPEIERLQRFITQNPALQDVPFLMVKGKPMSPREALENLQAGILTEEISAAIQRTLGSPQITLEELWVLAEEHYRRMMQVPKPWPKIIWIGGEMNYEEAYQQVKQRTARGREIAESYRDLLAEMKRRLHA